MSSNEIETINNQKNSQKPIEKKNETNKENPRTENKNLSKKVETISLEKMTESMGEFLRDEKTIDEVTTILRDKGLNLEVVNESSDPENRLFVIRSENNLPGTRYFQLQLSENGVGQKTKVDHFSFEYRPGKNSMTEVVEELKKSFNLEGEPKIQRDDYVSYSVGHHLLWVKKMSEEDINKPHPRNVYTKEDIGTIQVVLEEDIHPER